MIVEACRELGMTTRARDELQLCWGSDNRIHSVPHYEQLAREKSRREADEFGSDVCRAPGSRQPAAMTTE
jgi:hypothetical protein